MSPGPPDCHSLLLVSFCYSRGEGLPSLLLAKSYSYPPVKPGIAFISEGENRVTTVTLLFKSNLHESVFGYSKQVVFQ